MTAFDALLKQMTENRIIPNLRVPCDDVIAVLDLRDGKEFETSWNRVHDALTRQNTAAGTPFWEKEKLTELRESAFMQTIRKWRSSELAGAVSDDFGLIGDALLLEFDDPWINDLLQTYMRGRIPTGESAAPDGVAADPN